MDGHIDRPRSILYVAQCPPWDQWAGSGFHRKLCTGLKQRALLYGAVPYFATSDRELLGLSKVLELRRRVLRKLGREPKRNEWNHESEGFVGKSWSLSSIWPYHSGGFSFRI